MNFTSPWQSRSYVKAVEFARVILRPFGRAENRFIEMLGRWQNRRVARHLDGSPARKILLIMPRCVKKTGCRADVQHGLEECLTCLGCPLGDVALICDRHQVEALVAFRSHIAFEMARVHRPDVIIAAACHDRMVKAWRSVPEIPALLAPLSGMERMCVNASIDLHWLEQQVAAVTAGALPAPDAAAGLAACRALPTVDCP